MITIIIFIVSLLLKSEPINHTCSLQTHISVFQIVLIVATGTEIFVKTILLEILSKCCISSITGIHYALVIFFVTVSLGMYGWSTQLLLQSRKEGGCQ
jgi:tyrosine-protein phosphatase YwqE